ncbi:MAG: hypothetical protein AB1705_13490 [Verrucomicrobiota bacterium]
MMHLVPLLWTLASGLHAAPLPSPVPRDDFWVTDGPVLALLEYNNTLYVGGNFSNVGPNTGKGAILPGAGTSPDVNWPKLNTIVYTAVPDGTGGWFVGGDSFDDDEPNPNVGNIRYLLTHLKSDQTVDTAFNPLPTGQIYTMLKDGNTLYVGGNFGSIGGVTRSSLAAIDLTTGQTTAWNPAPDFYVYALAKSGNTIYVGGAFVNVGGQEQRGLAAIDATTGAVQSFPALNIGGIVNALLVVGNTLFVGGEYTAIGGQTRQNLAAVDLPGGTINAFDAGVFTYGFNSRVNALATIGSKLYVGGAFDTVGGVASAGLAVLNLADASNTGANYAPVHFGNAFVTSLAVNGTMLHVGGRFTTFGGQARNYLAAVDTDKNQLATWNPRAAGGAFPVQVVAYDGANLFVGGYLVTVGALERKYIASFDLTTGEATTWNPNADGSVWALARHNNNIYAGGEFYNIGGASRVLLAGLDSNTGAATPLNPNFPSPAIVNQLLVSGDYLYAGGRFSYNLGHINLLKCDLTDNSVVPWFPDPLGDVYALALDGNTLYVGGNFTLLGGQSRNCLGAVDTTTGLATSWNPNPDSYVLSLALGDVTVYAGGVFNTIGGASRPNLAVLSKSTGLASSWNPMAGSSQRVLELAGNHLLMCGDFYGVGASTLSYFAVVDPTTASARSLNLQFHPFRIFAMHRGQRHYYFGGDQTGSRNIARPNLSVHRLAPFIHQPQPQLNGQIILPVDLLADQDYTLEATSDFQSWMNLGTYRNVTTITDTTASGQSRRIYRLAESNLE